jgi:hypothetical protein
MSDSSSLNALVGELRGQLRAAGRASCVVVLRNDSRHALTRVLRRDDDSCSASTAWLAPPPDLVPAHASAVIAAFNSALLMSGFHCALTYKSATDHDDHDDDDDASSRLSASLSALPSSSSSSSASSSSSSALICLSWSKPYFGRSSYATSASPTLRLYCGVHALQDAHTEMTCVVSDVESAEKALPSSADAVAPLAAAASASAPSSSDLQNEVTDVVSALELLSYATENRSIQAIVARRLLAFTDALSTAQLRFYSPQLCNLVLCFDCPDIEQFLFVRCADDFDFGMRAYFCFQGAVDDNNAKYAEKAQRLLHECEMATVNSVSSSVQSPASQPTRSASSLAASAEEEPGPIPVHDSHSDADDEFLALLAARRSSALASPAATTVRSRAATTPAALSTAAASEPAAAVRTPLTWRLRQSQQEAEDDQLAFAPLVRHRRLQAQLTLISALSEVARLVAAVPAADRPARNATLAAELQRLVEPLVSAGNDAGAPHHDARQCLLLPTALSYRIVRVACDSAFVLNSRERVPFMLFLETLGAAPVVAPPAPAVAAAAAVAASASVPATPLAPTPLSRRRQRRRDVLRAVPNRRASTPQLSSDATLDDATDNTEEDDTLGDDQSFFCHKCRAKLPVTCLATHADWHFEQESELPGAPSLRVSVKRVVSADSVLGASSELRRSADDRARSPWRESAPSPVPDEAAPVIDEQVRRRALQFSHEWDERCDKLRATSPFASSDNWRLASVIFKSGDDLRQEQLAMQLIKQFDGIFRAAKLPLWLYPYEVLAVSADAGFIETVPNTISVDVLRRSMPELRSMADYFVAAYGERGSARHSKAQRCFCESLAAYSLVCYFLQIKDRHNGNMLLDRHGHLLHIDFGFMLTSSPGQLGFESAPFKLTLDMVDVLGGVDSDMFHYFQVLLLRGFLELRRHSRRVLTLLQLMTHGSHLACLGDSVGVGVVDALRQRFQLHMTDRECVEHIVDLVSDSLESWSTHAYDYYQYFSNAIH